MIAERTESKMELRALGFLLLSWSLEAVFGRQMCWTCQYVLNGNGIECATAPGNWTGGEPRIKCPSKCTIVADFDAKTGVPKFFFRGCGDAQSAEGCSDFGSTHNCFYSCDDKDYCNSKPLPRSPLLEKSKNSSSLLTCSSSSFLLMLFLVILMYRH
ncbi:uncharacterized protein LOC131949148 [Physella acuta]|uniref:uncharacterized protein LOC131949148 n=1 Tax=Physella acuta TaxID=109671 RepID=UPI0027DCDFCD|nr:uncharacterized protein LOC131949148 [Physella acuta]XP_059166906.1 uncharacterized protein LOC131949148 [Physella acuta]